MPYICAAVMEGDAQAAALKASKTKADMVELRLDLMSPHSNLKPLLRVRKPSIATCMPLWEGGFFEGSEEERILFLHKSLDFVDYVCLELNMGGSSRAALISAAKARGIKTIVSHHDFRKTPQIEDILDVLQREEYVGADIAKIAYMPHSEEDVLNVLAAQIISEVKIPIIALSMGQMGRVSRVIGPMLGGYLSFASEDERSTAAGQYSVSEMHKIKKILWKK
jgi:3-dehydroquinate dehydratase I